MSGFSGAAISELLFLPDMLCLWACSFVVKKGSCCPCFQFTVTSSPTMSFCLCLTTRDRSGQCCLTLACVRGWKQATCPSPRGQGWQAQRVGLPQRWCSTLHDQYVAAGSIISISHSSQFSLSPSSFGGFCFWIFFSPLLFDRRRMKKFSASCIVF